MNKIVLRLFSFVVISSILLTSISSVAAVDSKEDINIKATYDESDEISFGEAGGYLIGNLKTTKKLYADRKFGLLRGHGFAAENGNNLYDSFKGIKTKVVGDNNIKNGPDRIVFNKNGTITQIQDKYYSTAKNSVNAAFDSDGMYKYVDGDGYPMQLEVPADQYESSVSLMKEKIKNGKIRNVSDPSEAENIVKKGKLSYKQARNLTKAGNIDSLKYDAATGVIATTSAAGISFVMNLAIATINGEDISSAFSDSLKDSLKTGAVVGITHILVSQLSKTSVNKLYVPAGEALTKVFGENMCKAILESVGVSSAGKSVLSKAAKIVSSEIHFQIIMLVVLTIPDIVDLFRGRISPEQLIANLTVSASGLAGGLLGAWGGATVGAAIGNAPGAAIGGVVGGVIGGAGASIGTHLLIDNFTESDAEKMCAIIQEEFGKLSEDYIVSKDEADKIVDAVQSKLDGETLKNMYASEDRNKFANDLMAKEFEKEIAKRKVSVPSEFDIRIHTKETLNNIIFIH